jgi:hypothetical protein
MSQRLRFVSPLVLFCAATLPLAATTIGTATISIDGTEVITGPNRVIRNNVASSIATPKAFPGQAICLGNCFFRTATWTPTDTHVTVKITGLTNGGNVFLVAYLNSFDPNSLATNYLGDAGASTPIGNTVSFQVNVPAGNQLVLVLMDNIAGLLGSVSYEVAIPDPTPPGNPTAGVPVSPITLGVLAMLLAVGGGLSLRKAYS